MHPRTKLRNNHYLKRVRKEIEERNEDSDLWKRLAISFEPIIGNYKENRPILDDEHR